MLTCTLKSPAKLSGEQNISYLALCVRFDSTIAFLVFDFVIINFGGN